MRIPKCNFMRNRHSSTLAKLLDALQWRRSICFSTQEFLRCLLAYFGLYIVRSRGQSGFAGHKICSTRRREKSIDAALPTLLNIARQISQTTSELNTFCLNVYISKAQTQGACLDSLFVQRDCFRFALPLRSDNALQNKKCKPSLRRIGILAS